MYIIPYYTIHKNGLRGALVFMCKNGREFWKSDGNETSKTIVKEYLVENGFVGNVKEVRGEFLFYEIDRKATRLDDFYMWLDEGVKEDSDVWRPWFFLEDKQEFDGEKDKILSVLREIVLKK